MEDEKEKGKVQENGGGGKSRRRKKEIKAWLAFPPWVVHVSKSLWELNSSLNGLGRPERSPEPEPEEVEKKRKRRGGGLTLTKTPAGTQICQEKKLSFFFFFSSPSSSLLFPFCIGSSIEVERIGKKVKSLSWHFLRMYLLRLLLLGAWQHPLLRITCNNSETVNIR